MNQIPTIVCPACASEVERGLPACPQCGANMVATELPTGSLLQGDRYRIERFLGQGGFGITYLGHDSVLGRTVAIKEFFMLGSVRHTSQVSPPTSLGAEALTEAKQRFIEEARTLAGLQHPGIVRVLDVFEGNNTAYMVMDYIQGPTLGSLIGGGPLEAVQVAELARGLGEALEVVHQAGLLHRDIKPDNVLLAGGIRPVLVDFGSARTFAEGQTVRHTRMVTPGYAPPEQYASSAKFGPYTDIYSLAATLYHCLTGRIPPPATDRMMGNELPPLPSGIPEGLGSAITHGLSIRSDERPQTIASFLGLLQGDAPPVPAPVPKPVPTEKPSAAPRPRRRLGWLWALLTLLVLLGGGYASLPYLIQPSPAVVQCMGRLVTEAALEDCLVPAPGNATSAIKRLLTTQVVDGAPTTMQDTKIEVLNLVQEWQSARAYIGIGGERKITVTLQFVGFAWQLNLDSLANQALMPYKTYFGNGGEIESQLSMFEAGYADDEDIALARGKITQLLKDAIETARLLAQLDPQASLPLNATQMQELESNLAKAIQTGLDRAEADRLSEEANNLYKQGSYSESLDRIQRARALREGLGDNQQSKLALLTYLESYVYRDFKESPNNMQRAIESAQLSTQLNSGESEYWCHLGDLLRLYNDFSSAEQAFERGLNVADTPKERSSCLTWYGMLDYRRGYYGDANTRWLAALILDPNNSDARRFLNDF